MGAISNNVSKTWTSVGRCFRIIKQLLKPVQLWPRSIEFLLLLRVDHARKSPFQAMSRLAPTAQCRGGHCGTCLSGIAGAPAPLIARSEFIRSPLFNNMSANIGLSLRPSAMLQPSRLSKLRGLRRHAETHPRLGHTTLAGHPSTAPRRRCAGSLAQARRVVARRGGRKREGKAEAPTPRLARGTRGGPAVNGFSRTCVGKPLHKCNKIAGTTV